MIYAIGDIHGHNDKLERLLQRLDAAGMRPEDLLVFVGDYIDRGPDTCGVLERLIALRDSRPNTVFLRGNHEQMLLDARHRYDSSFDSDNACGNDESGVFWFVEGGEQTLRSYNPLSNQRWLQIIPPEHWQFIRSTRLEHHAGGYKFVHAGVLPAGKRWSMTGFEADPRLWIRQEFISSESDFDGQVIVFGHTPTRDGNPLLLWNKVAIDTGAGYGAPLTAVGLPEPYAVREVQIWQAV